MADLAVSNPNHLKQFLEVGKGGIFKGYDLDSLRVLFSRENIPFEVLYQIELRGVVPNKNM